MGWGDEQAPECHINRAFVSELHKTIVANLTPRRVGEGDHAPGEYRSSPLEINGSEHVPPPNYLIDDLMEELFAFMGNDLPAQYYLLKVAIAHHRLMWIHPFGNGNGRTGRLFTYAILVKTGFRVHVGQILNPTAVFCIDRDRYNALLSRADEGTDEGIVEWCVYVWMD